jgi:hypothetical protein
MMQGDGQAKAALLSLAGKPLYSRVEVKSGVPTSDLKLSAFLPYSDL